MPQRIERRWRLLLIAAAGLLASGCNHIYEHRDAISPQAGDAIAANKVAQMVDPWPEYAADRNVPADGQRMQRAVERYRTNRVTPLATTSTSSAPYAAPAAPPAAAGAAPGSP